MATPDYVLTEDYNIMSSSGQDDVLKAGTFIRPISWYYLPAHIKDSIAGRWHNPELKVFCWCRRGIIEIPLTIVRKI